MTAAEPVILLADDNEQVSSALRLRIERSDRYRWAAGLDRADTLLEEVRRVRPDVVVIDVDMPGRDPFDAIAELSREHPEVCAVVFSGHSRFELIARAIEAGAWAYVSKNDGDKHLFDAIDRVLAGEFVLSPEADAVFGGGPAV